MLENFKQKRERVGHGFEDDVEMCLRCIVCVKLWAGSGSPRIRCQLSVFCGQGDESLNAANTAGIFFTDRMVVSGCQCTRLWSCTENRLPLLIAALRGHLQ